MSEKKEVFETLEALQVAENKIANLEARQRELNAQKETADGDVEVARESLDKAVEKAAVEGDIPALQQARETLEKAKRFSDGIAEQIEAIERVIGRSKLEIPSLLNEAQRAHRVYWKTVEQKEREKAKGAGLQILRAYAAYLNASSGGNASLEGFLNGGGVGGGLLPEIGLSAYSAAIATREIDFGDGVPVSKPYSRYGTSS